MLLYCQYSITILNWVDTVKIYHDELVVSRLHVLLVNFYISASSSELAGASWDFSHNS